MSSLIDEIQFAQEYRSKAHVNIMVIVLSVVVAILCIATLSLYLWYRCKNRECVRKRLRSYIRKSETGGKPGGGLMAKAVASAPEEERLTEMVELSTKPNKKALNYISLYPNVEESRV